MRALPASFFRRPAERVARELVGATLVSRLGGGVVRARIVETEAYLGRGDPASHAFGGRRHAGNASIYCPPGFWYVYRSYGIHWCANLVTGPAGEGAAVLIRAVTIEGGVELARRRRRGRSDRELANGPGKLCEALAIDRTLDGVAMVDSAVIVGPGDGAGFRASPIRPANAGRRASPPASPAPPLLVTPRIGITKAVDWPLRFLAGDPHGRL
ncbi:MAG: DNA-3-methyladenine glycosylase [Gemmatimonadales bacterium]